MTTRFSLLLILPLVLLAGCAGQGKKLAHIMEDVQRTGRIKDIKGIEMAAAQIDGKYITPQLLSSYSDETISELFQTLRYPAVYLPDNETTPLQMKMILDEKAKRNTYTDEEVSQTFFALAEARMFEKAEQLRQTFQKVDLPKIPTMIPGTTFMHGNWLVYDITDNGSGMRLAQLPLGTGAKIILFMLPGCPSGEESIKTLLSDPTFGPIFRKNAVIIMRRFEPEAIEKIKKTFNFPAVYIAHKSADFPGIEMMHSPDCFFLKDGKVLSRHRGWSDSAEHNAKITYKGLNAIGLTKD